MVLDYSNPDQLTHEYETGRVFVDGREIKLAWYIDTELGMVRTYDVYGDGMVHQLKQGVEPPSGVEVVKDVILSKTVYGHVEVRKPAIGAGPRPATKIAKD